MLHTDIVARLDERAADAAANRLVSRFATAGKTSGDAFNTALEAEVARTNIAADRITSALEDRLAQSGSRAGRGFGGAFGSELAGSIPIVSGFTSAMSGYESAAGKAGAAAGRALGLAFTTAAAGAVGAVGYTLFKGFERYEAIDAAKNRLDNLNRTLEGTGRAGIDVKAVMDTVNQTVTDTPFALDKAFSVATRALASNTGDLKRFMTDVADSAGFAGAGIDEIGEAFLKIANTGKVSMDEVGNELRNIPILPWLQETLGVSGAELQKMIHDGKVGLEDLLQTVEQHAGGFAKAAGDTVSGALENVQTAVARLGANFLGAIFGQPTEDANDLVTVLHTLQDRIDQVGAWVTAHQEDIRRFFEEGAQAAGDIVNAIQTVLGALDKVGIGVDDVVTAFVAWKTIQGVSALTTQLGGVNTMLGTTLPTSAEKGAAGVSAAMSRIALPLWLSTLIEDKYPNFPIQDQPTGEKRIFPGWVPVLPAWEENIRRFAGDDTGGLPAGAAGPPGSGFGGAVKAFGDQFQPGSLGGPAGAQAERRGGATGGPSGGPAPAGNPILPPPGAGDSGGPKGPRLPPAPQLPYDSGVPQEFAQLPQTAQIVSAENSWLDARHTLAEKQARVDQLENDSNATQDDIIKAKNDVVNAQQAQQQAELQLYDARTSLYDKSNKQLKKQASDMSDIGAKLDADFGISKGLAGIADNLTRFLANLAAAPMLGQLAAIRDASPSQGGYGLMGIMGAQGAFGPNFTGIDTSKQDSSSKQVAVLQPGGGVGYTTVGGSGAPYGLPGGTDTGGYGTGTSSTFPPWVMALANAFNVKPSTYSGHQESDRDEAGYAPNPTHENRGIDWSGTPQDMQRFADYLKTVPGMEQVIWNGAGVGTGDTVEIAGGRPQPGYFAGDLAGHGNHVHTRQSQAIPLPGGGIPTGDSSAAPSVFSQASSGGTGSFPIPLPVTIVGGGPGGAIGAPAGSAASGQGAGALPGPSASGIATPAGTGAEAWRDTVSQVFDKYAAAAGVNPAAKQQWVDAIVKQIDTESKGDPGADNPNDSNGQGGTQHVSGLLQYLPSTYANSGGKLTGLPYMDPVGQIAGALLAPRTAAGAPDLSAPGGIGAGHGWGPSATPTSSGWGGGGIPTVGGGQAGGPGPSMPIGGGLGANPALGGGPDTGATAIGGVDPLQGTGKGGVGITPGGSLDTAMSMAASAFPGLGQAAQTGMKLASRAIQFGGQAVGIGVQGAMDTFLPFGGSKLAQNSWLTRIVGGLAGAAPALPNMAGKSSGPSPEQVAGAPGAPQGGQGQGGNTTNNNVTVNNQRATEDGTGRDVMHYLGNQGPGM